MKKVSIIIPVYNTAKYLADCIKSVIEQTLNDIEIIIINDGSTDQSEKIIKTFCQKDNRIIYIYQNNTGVSCVRNKGIEFANGEYIFFLDSDDLIGKHFLENLYNTAKTNNSEIVITKPNLYNNLDTSKPSTLITHAGFYNLKFLKNNPDIRFPTGKNLNREDGVFAHFALSKTEKISICNNALYYYRQNPEQITSQITRNPKLIFKTIVPILNYIEGFYTTNNLWYSNRELLAKYIQDELFYSCFYSISRKNFIIRNFVYKKLYIFSIKYIKNNLTKKEFDILGYHFKRMINSRNYIDFEIKDIILSNKYIHKLFLKYKNRNKTR